MAQIQEHVQAVHLGHKITAQAAQPPIIRFQATIPHQTPLVVGRLTDAHAQVIEKRKPLQISLKHAAVFEAKNQSQSIGGLGERQVTRP